MYSAFLCSLNTYQAWFSGATRICASSQCMQSAFKIQDYLVLKVHAVVDVHKPFVLSGSLYGGELNPSRLPKNPWYGVRFTIKTPILYLQRKAFRKQAWKMASTKRCKKHRVQIADRVLWTAFRKNVLICWGSMWADWVKTIIFYFIYVMSHYSYFFILFWFYLTQFYFTSSFRLRQWKLRTGTVWTYNLFNTLTLQSSNTSDPFVSWC